MLLDVINFNPDASCLSSQQWLYFLKSDHDGLYSWLQLYVRYQRPVVLGMCGSCLADIAAYAPRCLDIIRLHDNLFSFAARPFAHDAAFFRSNSGARLNIELGLEMHKHFGLRTLNLYLPPEFMVGTREVHNLASLGITNIVLNPGRFSSVNTKENTRTQLSAQHNDVYAVVSNPYWTSEYLHVLHGHADQGARHQATEARQVSWRDGESWMLIRDGLRSEERWLQYLSDVDPVYEVEAFINSLEPAVPLGFYPRHSLKKWNGESKAYDLISNIEQIESRLQELTLVGLNDWLYMIGSDALSCLEKDDVRVKIRSSQQVLKDYLITRKDRHIEAELLALSFMEPGLSVEKYFSNALIDKLDARRKALQALNVKAGRKA